MSFGLVLVSGGKSTRFLTDPANRNSIPKTWIEWDGKPMFIHSLSNLFSAIDFEEAVVVAPESDVHNYRQVLDRFEFRNVQVTKGGARRQDSVRSGLRLLSKSERVAIHDAARPFLTKEFLVGLFETAKTRRAVVPGLAIYETIKEIDNEGFIKQTHPRNRFVRIQTPQIFDRELIRNLHEKLSGREHEFTDDAMLAEHVGEQVFCAKGDPQNIKVTTPEDLRPYGII